MVNLCRIYHLLHRKVSTQSVLHTLGAESHHAKYKTVTTTAFAGDADGDAYISTETLWS